MAKLTRERVFALRGYTVKIEDGQFYFAPTIAFQNKLAWSKPYKSLQHVTTAIARKLQAEFAKRNTALGGWHVQYISDAQR